jgi:hypothetical protein
MSFSKALLLVLAVATVNANPVPSPSQIERRDPPAPSSYPLDTACGHEWQYLNFNPSDATDMSHLETLHNVICSGELRAISSWGASAAQSFNLVYQRYFPESDEEDDFETHVYNVLTAIAGTSSTDGSIGSIVGSFVIDNDDFTGGCANDETLAYTDTDR